ncbi:MAG: OmpA family protein [Desulfobulbaceae bacterium]|nr:OmpA family protein [Desulfobulbaceae bacterium]
MISIEYYPKNKRSRKMIRTTFFFQILILSLFSLLFTGCATKRTVRHNIITSEQKQSQAIAELRQELTAKIDQLEGMGEDSAVALRLAREASQATAKLRTEFEARKNLAEKVRETVYFGFDQHDLSNIAQANLDKIADMMNSDNRHVMLLMGHTDGRGSESYNYALSYRRVASVIGYLVTEKNSDLSRIHLVGLGESYPAADNSSEKGRRENRRVVIKILGPR